jgi:hypothetical protein
LITAVIYDTGALPFLIHQAAEKPVNRTERDATG